MGGGEGKSRKRRSSPSSGEQEGRERRRRDKKESRRSGRDDREDDDDRHKKRNKGKHSDRDKGKERDSKDRHSKEKEKSKRKDMDASASRGGQVCSNFQAFCMSNKSKATSDVSFNPNDPPEVYSDPSVYTRISDYTSAARKIHGPEYDPSTQDIDAELVMMLGGGKKHGRFWIGDDIIDNASIPSLSQSRAQSTSGPTIRQWSCPSQHLVDTLETQLVESQRQCQELKAKLQMMEARLQGEQALQEAQAKQLEAQAKQLAYITAYMQGLSAHMGYTFPPELLVPPPTRPAHATPSAGSNSPTPEGDQA